MNYFFLGLSLLLLSPTFVFSQETSDKKTEQTQISLPLGGAAGGFTGGVGGGFTGGMFGGSGEFQNPGQFSSLFGSSEFGFESSSDNGSSSLNRNCRPEGSNLACGECEQGLQNQFNDLIADITGQSNSGEHWSDTFGGKASIKPGVTLESTLARIKDMMKSNNPAGGNGLNFIVIGESESLQPTTVRDGKMYPRIALKSPNSELWVTFNTDPNEPTYSTLEIMRWNGKNAKYEFMELDFNPRNRHMDGTGEKCISCHKQPDPRPNWDTYRAWSGVVPSRDDMLEMHGKNYQYATGDERRMGTDGRAYLSFLDQVVDAKESKPNDRLAMLDIPIDDQIQFKDSVPPVSQMTPREQLEAIRRRTESDGFYRIPHFPYKAGLGQSNFDQKTASYTGPSQAAFDQMSGQNFCRISQRLKEHPEYDKFKYYLAGMGESSCRYEMTDAQDMKDWIPESYRKKIVEYFGANPNISLRNLATAGEPTAFDDFPGLMDRLVADTEANHSQANGFKVERHTRFLQSYLGNVENKGPEVAAQEAQYFSESLTAPTHSGFHAIGDEGGVNGVGEDSAEPISSLRAVLSPLGINVGQWSMMRGNDPDYDSLAFSDQFSLLYQQAAIQEVLAEVRKSPEFQANNGNLCQTLQQKSYQALSDPLTIQQTGPLANEFDVESWCRERLEAESFGESLSFSDNMKDIFKVSQNMMNDEAKEFSAVCIRCHGSNGFSPFPGMDNISTGQAWTDQAWGEFQAALRGEAGNRDFPLGPMVINKMLLGQMPPGGWRHGDTPEERGAEDTRRRDFLANYTKITMVTSDNDESIQAYCRSIMESDLPNATQLAPAGDMSNAGASQQ